MYWYNLVHNGPVFVHKRVYKNGKKYRVKSRVVSLHFLELAIRNIFSGAVKPFF
jgi:hypothetical protein